MTVGNEDLVKWISDSLSRFLNFSDTEDVARYITTIDLLQDVKDYLLEILDKTNQDHVQFVEQLIYQLDGIRKGTVKKAENSKYSGSNDVYKGARPKKKFVKVNEEKTESFFKKFEDNRKDNLQQQKKGKKFVPLYSQEGKAKDIVKIPGRQMCECEAKQHELINNCLNCGRIVCDQEGAGPCFYCGTLVCSKADQELINRNSKKGKKLYEQLMRNSNEDQQDEALEKAIQNKNKLLEFDRTSQRRTQVIDDQADYYSTDSNKWLTAKERKLLNMKREEMQGKKHASRRDMKYTFDFAGRKVFAENEEPPKEINPSVLAANYGVDVEGSKLATSHLPKDVQTPKYECDEIQSQNKKIFDKHLDQGNRCSRLQSKDIQTMSDHGRCLSMHQPYASLLVSGIKKHEGRSWYTPHRGRLWIGSTVKESTPQENSQLERMYREHYEDPYLKFPQQYPPGCLLGHVDVIDCLGQEEYRQKFPNGESSSPYVLICENPKELLLKFPMKGDHKIYSLDPNIHKAAQNVEKL